MPSLMSVLDEMVPPLSPSLSPIPYPHITVDICQTPSTSDAVISALHSNETSNPVKLLPITDHLTLKGKFAIFLHISSLPISFLSDQACSTAIWDSGDR